MLSSRVIVNRHCFTSEKGETRKIAAKSKRIMGRKCTRRLSSSLLSSALSLLGYSHRSPFSASSSSKSSSLSLLTVEFSASLQLQNLICVGRNVICVGEQGWRSGESTASHQCGPYVGCVCCWFSPYSHGFSPGSPVFLSPQKPTLTNSNLIGNF